jgi:hypothetical protein
VRARPVYVRGKTHIGTCDEDRRIQHRILIRIVLQPSEELRNAIDLIIVTTVWKWQKLREELAEPQGAVRQVDVTRLKLRRLGRHSIDFAALRPVIKAGSGRRAGKFGDPGMVVQLA